MHGGNVLRARPWDKTEANSVVTAVIGNARNKHELNPLAIVDAWESWRLMVSFGAKLRARDALIARDGADSKPKADAIRKDFSGVSEISAGALVAVPVGPQSHPVVKASVNAWIDVVQPAAGVAANKMKPNRLCASQHREQQQEKEAKHDDLRCDEEIIGALSNSHKIVQTLS